MFDNSFTGKKIQFTSTLHNKRSVATYFDSVIALLLTKETLKTSVHIN